MAPIEQFALREEITFQRPHTRAPDTVRCGVSILAHT